MTRPYAYQWFTSTYTYTPTGVNSNDSILFMFSRKFAKKFERKFRWNASQLYLYSLPNHFFQPDGSGCCLATGLRTLSPCESTTPTRTLLRLLWSVDSWDSRLKRRFKASCEENEFHGIKQKSNNSHNVNWVISCQVLPEIWNYFTVLSELSDFLYSQRGFEICIAIMFARLCISAFIMKFILKFIPNVYTTHALLCILYVRKQFQTTLAGQAETVLPLIHIKRFFFFFLPWFHITF